MRYGNNVLKKTVMSGNIIKLMKASLELFNLCSHKNLIKAFTPSTGTVQITLDGNYV